MTAYLGPAGKLVPFACPSDEQISLGDRVKTRLTFGGVQKAQYVKRSPRAWRVGIGTATPRELSQLGALMQGLYGPPPWVYVGPWAQVTNLLTPAGSTFEAGTWDGSGVAGPAATLDGGITAGRSVVNASGANFDVPTSRVGQGVPVVPGVPVTVSLWGAGVSYFELQLNIRDAAGNWILTKTVRTTAPAGAPMVRGSVTAIPPAGAVDCFVRVAGALRAALPAFTWTPDMADWAMGGGAPKVVALDLAESVQLAVHHQPTLRRSSLSFTLEEVGNA